jgi:protein-tyrosine phosphatase
VEFGEQFVPEHMDNVFYDLQVAGLIPILTHPERNPVFRRKPETLYRFATRGCLVQVTAQSYTGDFGSHARELCEMWLERNLINFFASDAHDTRHRPPLLSACYEKLEAARGPQEADRLMKQNPGAVIAGRALPPGPEPIAPRTRKRPWFLFWRH